MAKHRTDSIEFKRQVVQEFLGGESPNALAKRDGISRNRWDLGRQVRGGRARQRHGRRHVLADQRRASRLLSVSSASLRSRTNF